MIVPCVLKVLHMLYLHVETRGSFIFGRIHLLVFIFYLQKTWTQKAKKKIKENETRLQKKHHVYSLLVHQSVMHHKLQSWLGNFLSCA